LEPLEPSGEEIFVEKAVNIVGEVMAVIESVDDSTLPKWQRALLKTPEGEEQLRDLKIQAFDQMASLIREGLGLSEGESILELLD